MIKKLKSKLPTGVQLGTWLIKHPWINTYLTVSLWFFIATFNIWWGALVYLVVFIGWMKFFDHFCIKTKMDTAEYLAALAIPISLWLVGGIALGFFEHLFQMGEVVRCFFGITLL